MIKVIAIGDVHTDFEKLWQALRFAYAADEYGMPTPPVIDGRYQVILMGDLVHPKTKREYAALSGYPDFDAENPDHLQAASRAQAQELLRLKRYAEAAPYSIHIILGNHDDSALTHSHRLGNAFGVVHDEFDESRGGLAFSPELQRWFESFPRDIRLGRTHFAHVGPMLGMSYYDDMFYGDRDSKHWWHTRGHLVQDSGFNFGVYGHVVMPEGVHIDALGRFAMVDALDRRQYLELIFDDDHSIKPDYKVVTF